MNPTLIEEIAALIVEGGQLAFALYLKLEPLLNIGPNEKSNIANAIAASDKADTETISAAQAWLAANPPAPPIVQAPTKPPVPPTQSQK